MAEPAAPPRARIVAWLTGESVADARQAPARTVLLFLAPALLVYAGFTIYPVLRTFYNSVHTIGPHNVQTFVGLGNFVDLVTPGPRLLEGRRQHHDLHRRRDGRRRARRPAARPLPVLQGALRAN